MKEVLSASHRHLSRDKKKMRTSKPLRIIIELKKFTINLGLIMKKSTVNSLKLFLHDKWTKRDYIA